MLSKMMLGSFYKQVKPICVSVGLLDNIYIYIITTVVALVCLQVYNQVLALTNKLYLF